MKLGSSNIDRNYNHNIDKKIKDIIQNLGFCSKNQLLRELQRYFPTISKKTVERHLDKMVKQNILQYRKEKNRHLYSFTESAEIALKTELFENAKPKKQNKKSMGLSFSNINTKNNNNNNEFNNNKIAYFLILSQAAAGSRIFSYNKSYILDNYDNNSHLAIPDLRNHRKLVTGDFKWEEGITQEDVLKKTNISIKSAFPNFNPTKSIIQQKFEELENQYGFKGRIQKRMRRSNGDIAIEIVDDYLRQFILWLETIFHMVEYRIRYGWIWKRSIPSRRSQEFRWYLSTFGREKTIKVLIKASHFKDYFNQLDKVANDKNKKSKLKDQIKTILNHLDKNVVGFYHSFILCDDRYLSEYIKFQHHIEFSSNDDRQLIQKHISKDNKEQYQIYKTKIKDLRQNNKEMAKILQLLIDEIYYPKFLQHKHTKEGL